MPPLSRAFKTLTPLFSRVPSTKPGVFEASADGASLELAVLLPPYGDGHGNLDRLLAAIRKILPSAATLRPDVDLRNFSYQSLESITAQVLIDIDNACAEAERVERPFRRIHLVGHSLGGIIARKVYVAACGQVADRCTGVVRAPLEEELLEAGARQPKVWAHLIERLVLLAPINRGWSINPHLSTSNFLAFSAGILIGNIAKIWRGGRSPMIFGARRGGGFLSNLRAQWIFMRRQAAKYPDRPGGALVVQLLGTEDDLVAPSDSVDPYNTDETYLYLEVPHSSHLSIAEISGDDEISRMRWEIFELALTGDPKVISERQPFLGSDFERVTPRDRVTDVAFVIHGIRDLGYWTQHIATRIAQRAKHRVAEGKQQRNFSAETSTYGYFPMISFLNPVTRRAKTTWLVEQYLENLMLFPKADRFHYVGHSNGTYLLARGLRDFPFIRFDKVVLAGSVVQCTYPWKRMIADGRIQRVLNYVASADAVVAIFPKALGRLGFDLGSAGHDGFDDLDDHDGTIGYQVRFATGGHGAALEEGHWDDIADFVVQGEYDEKKPRPLTGSVRKGFTAAVAGGAGMVPLLTLLLVLMIVIAICVTAWLLPTRILPVPMQAYFQPLSLLGAIGLVWFILRRY